MSRARYTSPIPPAPSDARISYGPSLVPEVRAIVWLWIISLGSHQARIVEIEPSGPTACPLANLKKRSRPQGGRVPGELPGWLTGAGWSSTRPIKNPAQVDRPSDETQKP